MIFIVYSKDRYKEYVIENSDSDNAVLKIARQDFMLKSSIVLRIEKINGRKVIFSPSGSLFIKDGLRINSVTFTDEVCIGLETVDGVRLNIYALAEKKVMPVMKKYVLDTDKTFSVGSGTSDISYNGFGLVSRNHTVLTFKNGGWHVYDRSTNGTYINGKRLYNSHRLHFGDEISVFGLKIVYFGTIMAVSTLVGEFNVAREVRRYDISRNVLSKIGDSSIRPFFNRSPRNLPNIFSGEINIDAPPETEETDEKSLLSTIGRPLTMAIPMLLGCVMMAIGMGGKNSFMVIGVITSVSSAVIGAIWAILNMGEQDAKVFKKERKRFNTYGNYLISIANDLSVKYWHNYQAMHSIYPSSSVCMSYNVKSVGLWNRNSTHNDFLFVRLGLGDVPFQFNIKIPKQSFTLSTDDLISCPEMIKNEYTTLRNVPVGIDLMKNRLIGIVGKNDIDNAVKLTHLIIAQIAASVSYTDVKIVLINDKHGPKDEENWSFMRWLPHCWSEDKKVRFFSMNSADAEDVNYELTNILRRRSVSENSQSEKTHYIVIVTDMSLLERSLLTTYLLDPKEEYGVTTLLLSRSISRLPNSCYFSVESDGHICCVSNNMMDVNDEKTYIRQDKISVAELNDFTHRVANIEVDEKEVNQSIPSKVDFLSMYGTTNAHDLHISDRWRAAKISDSISVPIGIKAGGEICCLDIHEKYHGPHGLVAGTTGSGKSELLQSYILSLCVNFSPEDINFFIIDYKGGGMANLFSELPHMSGQITNLSGNQIRRAMISIKSEIIRRQMLFSEYGVNSINQYTQLYKDGGSDIAVAHLLIIIDEFAELKKAESDFMRELISVAQVGRSLGIHLILATQKPSGTVDDNIRSNSKFRLCLRVQDRQDSMDMIHHVDAAHITQAGGCIIQVGNDEIFEQFQSAWSGEIYSEYDTKNDNSAVMLTLTGKPALTGNRAKIKRAEQHRLDWYAEIIYALREILGNRVDLNDISGQNLIKLHEQLSERLAAQGTEWKQSPASLRKIISVWSQCESRDKSTEETAEEMIAIAAANSVKLPSPEEKKQLDAVLSEIILTAKNTNCKAGYMLWLPLLPHTLVVDELSCWQRQSYLAGSWEHIEKDWTLETVIGLVDDPANRVQEPVFLDFAHGGNHAVIGTVVSGKSIFLQTALYGLVNAYTPDHLNLYIIDFSSRMLSVFEGLPHVGGIVCEGEDEKLEKLMHLLSDILSKRKNLLSGGSYSEYIKTHKGELPAIILAVDNYSGFREKTESKYEGMMMQLSREGIGYGIYLLVSASGFSMSEITNRMAENMRTVFTLELTDKFKYVEAMRTTKIAVIPEIGIHGRGLTKYNGECLEFQTALINSKEDDYSRAKEAEKLFGKMKECWRGNVARSIPEIPKNPTFEILRSNDTFSSMLRSKILPVGYDSETAELVGLDLSSLYTYMIIGQSRSGKSNAIQLIMCSAMGIDNCQSVLYSKADNLLSDFAKKNNCKILSDSKALFDFFKELTPVFVERNKEKHSPIAENLTDRAVFDKMQRFAPIFIFIDDLEAFFNDIYSPAEGVSRMSGFIENILEKGELHNIYFIGCINGANINSASKYKGFGLFNRDRKGMLLATAISSQRLIDFGKISYSEGSKVPEFGTAYMQTKEDGKPLLCKAVLPLAGR